jgi:ABC-type antimicrobial peptide transport system permease subunit
LLGIGGSAAGVAIASELLWLFSLAPLTFSIEPQPLFVAGSFAVGVAVALASSIIPARRTSGLDPIEVIQSG